MVRRSSITSMFASSPVKPLQKHIEKVHECVKRLEPFFEAVILKDFDQVAVIQKEINKLETEADDLKHKLRIHLPNSLFMPMPRERILDIVTVQDQIANKAKRVTRMVRGRKMAFPKEVAKLMTTYVQCCVSASHQAKRVVNELDELVEVGFRGREVSSVEKMIDDLDQIEHKADKLEQQTNNALFKIEKDLDPIDVMFIYRVIQEVGEVADIAQRVGARLELLLAR
jgi:predicted phosphate transport protein (TIGR00153 family)